MIDQIVTYLPWLLSVITIYTMFLAGDRKSYTWLVGLANQALWLVWIIASSAWGLLPMNLALWFVYGRNHLKWAAKPST
jgi:hypothetical protein